MGTRGFGRPDHQATTEPPRAAAGGPAGALGAGGAAGKRGVVGKVRAGLGTGVGRIRATTRRDGADRSGLAALLDLSVINAAGDALVTVALAGSLFFSVPTGQARSKVALYLLITMVPFVLLAPVIGPLLDKVAHGRRTALAALCLGRCLLAWQLAVNLTGLQVYPLALGLLMLSRAFGVARSAVIPRVAPPELTLVKVNSRMSMVNIAASTAAAPIGLGIAHIPYVGYPWVLRLCALLYMVGVLLSFNLPKRVDSNEGERSLREIVHAATGPRAARQPAPADPTAALAGLPSQGALYAPGGYGPGGFVSDGAVGPVAPPAGRRGRFAGLIIRCRTVIRAALGASPVALRSTLILRSIVGFLTFFLAFLLRTEGGNNLWLGGLAASAALGSGLGVLIGGRLGRRRPERILVFALLLTAVGSLLAAVHFGKLTALFAALLAMLAASMAKLALDAIIQRDTADDVRNSAFARSETVLQLGWVAGGALGLIEMPGALGFLATALVPAAALFPQAREIRRTRAAARRSGQFRQPGAGPGTWAVPPTGMWIAPDGRAVLPTMMPPPADAPPAWAPAPGSPTGWAPASGPPPDWVPASGSPSGWAPAPGTPFSDGTRPWGPSAGATESGASDTSDDPDTTRPLGPGRQSPGVPPPRDTPNPPRQ